MRRIRVALAIAWLLGTIVGAGGLWIVLTLPGKHALTVGLLLVALLALVPLVGLLFEGLAYWLWSDEPV